MTHNLSREDIREKVEQTLDDVYTHEITIAQGVEKLLAFIPEEKKVDPVIKRLGDSLVCIVCGKTKGLDNCQFCHQKGESLEKKEECKCWLTEESRELPAVDANGFCKHGHKCDDKHIRELKSQLPSQPSEEWSLEAAQTAIDSIKLIKHYAQFSARIYQGFKNAIATERKKLKSFPILPIAGVDLTAKGYVCSGIKSERERILGIMESLYRKERFDVMPMSVIGAYEAKKFNSALSEIIKRVRE